MATAEQFAAWVKATPATDAIPDRDLICVAGDSSLMHVLKELHTYTVHSLPVLEPNTATSNDDSDSAPPPRVLGMIDVLDIACGIYELTDMGRFNKDGEFQAGDVAEAFIDTRPLQRLLESTPANRIVQRAAPAPSEVIATLPASFEGPEIPDYNIRVSDDLEQLLTKLGWDARHRVPVVDDEDDAEDEERDRQKGGGSIATANNAERNAAGASAVVEGSDTAASAEATTLPIINVISQSDLIRFLYKHIDQLPGKAALDQSLSKYSSKTLCKVNYHASLAEALYLFKQYRVLSLAIEDHNGGFVDELSARQFADQASNLAVYGMAVDEFIALKKKDGDTDSNSRQAVLVPPQTTVREAIKILAETSHYRLFITSTTTDAEGKEQQHLSKGSHRPIVSGVVSIRDIIVLLWTNLPRHPKSKTEAQD